MGAIVKIKKSIKISGVSAKSVLETYVKVFNKLHENTL